MDRYGQWTVKALRAELKRRGARCTGLKEELAQRLIDYDRNNNFQEDIGELPPPEDCCLSRQWPPDSSFRSVSNLSTCPAIDIVRIMDFFDTGDGKGSTMTGLVHRKGYSLMDSDFLAALVEDHVDGAWFYRGQVNSEFTKALTYFTKVIISESGDIVETSCECVAGKGINALCKHVAVVCYAVLRFRERGVWQIRKTCTERQQKWHMPKKSKIEVSPKKAQNLSFNVPQYSGMKKKVGNMCYDPRPEMFRNTPSFSDSVRNKVVNYTASRSHVLGINGILQTACVPALNLDHDYLSRPLLEQWIYNRIEGMAEDSVNIEKATRTQNLSREWHETRCFLLTASNVGEIVHMTDRRDKDSYAEGLVNPKSFCGVAMEWGKKNEKLAKAAYVENCHNEIQPCGLFICKKFPFIGGTPDGLIARTTVLEIKCPYSIKDEKISADNLKYLEERNGELLLKKSSNYYYQVQTQLLVTEREFCDFCVWTNMDFLRISVLRDDNVITGEIIPKIQDFHRSYMIPALVKKYFPNNYYNTCP